MYKVKDEFRKNALSLSPGGTEVHVVFPGETRIYDKVKHPKAFASSVIKKCKNEGTELPLKIKTQNEVLWEKS